ncbi:2-succinyl-5-enolpyruvyl-6-hydroxy-3-cyclohexene-1-carboxylic-acid synthase [Bacillus smithii]|uniref:2-succinyl-5-enolpyruvyl-6-hydroxy-3- cyclohexene-1-carboxylic-acid synthase n=1 Tax=Bacillus smithii TaxID=1479 RepID=UPI003D2121B8
MNNESLTLYLSHFIDELTKAGVRHVVVSPGSRSTPMAMLMAEHPDLHLYLHIDERSAGFFALGMAKALRKPIALLCTSGTAAANYYPAVIEANYARIPLIVLTADRPHELREVGAPQAIDQNHLYGRHVKWFVDMALPETGDTMLRYARSNAARSVYTASQAPMGPVHLNFPFREPLIPDYEHAYESITQAGQTVQLQNVARELPEEELEGLAHELAQYERGIIVCGALDSTGFSEQVVKLSKALGFPVLADPLSQLRSGPFLSKEIIDSYDSFLRNQTVRRLLAADVIIRFGAMPVSKALTFFLQENRDAEQWVVDGGGLWRDPSYSATRMIACEETSFCRKLSEKVRRNHHSRWIEKWIAVNEKTKEWMRTVNDVEFLDEGKLFYQLHYALPEGATLFVGNSMPIRDVDSFFFKNSKQIEIMANRGANGIDGVVSTAMGASVFRQPLFLVIGDLSLFHDMNGLLAAKLHRLNVNIIIVNNNGGGIFSYLPQAEHPKHFEELFGTPIDLDYSLAAEMYGGDYQKISNWDEFQESVQKAVSHEGLSIIEVPTNREKNVMVHRQLWKNVSREITSMLLGERK